jgi:hypothetical protein
MRKALLAICLALTIVICLQQKARAGAQDFTLFNRTGVDIYSLYISPSDTNDWQEDILGQDMMLNGADLHITFDRDEAAEKWDLRVADKAGNWLMYSDLNLPQINEIILEEDGVARCK